MIVVPHCCTYTSFVLNFRHSQLVYDVVTVQKVPTKHQGIFRCVDGMNPAYNGTKEPVLVLSKSWFNSI